MTGNGRRGGILCLPRIFFFFCPTKSAHRIEKKVYSLKK